MKRKSDKHIEWEIKMRQDRINKLQIEIDELNEEKASATKRWKI